MRHFPSAHFNKSWILISSGSAASIKDALNILQAHSFKQKLQQDYKYDILFSFKNQGFLKIEETEAATIIIKLFLKNRRFLEKWDRSCKDDHKTFIFF